MEWGVDETLKILHIDIDPVPDRGPAPTLKLVGDLGDAVPRISAALGNAGPDRTDWRTRIAAVKAAVSAEIDATLAPSLAGCGLRSALPGTGCLSMS